MFGSCRPFAGWRCNDKLVRSPKRFCSISIPINFINDERARRRRMEIMIRKNKVHVKRASAGSHRFGGRRTV